jgi:hypothetical protein
VHTPGFIEQVALIIIIIVAEDRCGGLIKMICRYTVYGFRALVRDLDADVLVVLARPPLRNGPENRISCNAATTEMSGCGGVGREIAV